MEIFLFPIGGVVAGFLAGYFLNLFGVFLLTVALIAWIVYEAQPSRNVRGSGTLGAWLIAMMVFIPFFVTLFITAFAYNNQIILPEFGNLLHWLKQTFLR